MSFSRTDTRLLLSLQVIGLAKNATPEELSALHLLVATATVRREVVNQPAETSPQLPDMPEEKEQLPADDQSSPTKPDYDVVPERETSLLTEFNQELNDNAEDSFHEDSFNDDSFDEDSFDDDSFDGSFDDPLQESTPVHVSSSQRSLICLQAVQLLLFCDDCMHLNSTHYSFCKTMESQFDLLAMWYDNNK